jgi:2-amino-4-hydroxy-6-hydroxymethyldihydropteridine diphosphokinase
MKQHSVFIAVGSNMGNKRLNCQKGINSITDSGHAILKHESGFYKTSPTDYKEQDWFINAAIQIDTLLTPYQLLALLEAIQLKIGRVHESVRFGPRILDLDIILYNDLVLDSEKLVIPHPRMHKRRFVLKPICDIAPHIIHPVLKVSMQELLNRIDDQDQKILAIT